jgi:HEAT repeat protein
VTRKDENELSEIARSISALFGGLEATETTATAAPDVAAEDHVDVSVALGLESELDVNARPDLVAAPSPESEAESAPLVDVEDQQEVDGGDVRDVAVEDLEEIAVEAPLEVPAEELEEVAVEAPLEVAAEDLEEVAVEAPLEFATEDLEEVAVEAPLEVVAEDLEEVAVEAPLEVTFEDQEDTDPVETEDPPTAVDPDTALDPATAAIAQELSEATSEYLEAPAAGREAARRAVHTAVEKARSAGALDQIASSANALLLRAAGDVEVEGLAGDLMDGDVVARMVVLLGRMRVEEEREVLIEAYVGLGDPVADAIAGALTDTEDRLARKTYVAALAAFGSAGAVAVEKMLGDSRWFVVRNGIAVLGAVGGESAIEHLTATLANEHAGVRRETVRSLAKIGGENAGLLVSSMLGDSDAEVRAAAARAVSVLKVERAYKQLMEILKSGDEDSVIEQVLRALGALGDASAVPAIVKRMKGSLLKRPPKEVRLAGLAALASIGTPHAVSLVEKARNDKDPEISAAAVGLLSGK